MARSNNCCNKYLLYFWFNYTGSSLYTPPAYISRESFMRWLIFKITRNKNELERPSLERVWGRWRLSHLVNYQNGKQSESIESWPPAPSIACILSGEGGGGLTWPDLGVGRPAGWSLVNHGLCFVYIQPSNLPVLPDLSHQFPGARPRLSPASPPSQHRTEQLYIHEKVN